MSTYLLLRDNKQSGPYSLDEIKSKGFKKYDLVWVEGRSAAWRYPGEVEELKAYAPIVEEQPFDRFFKKPSDEKKETRIMQEAVQKSQPEKIMAATNQVGVEIGDKKVFASLPVKESANTTQPTSIAVKPDIRKETIYTPEPATGQDHYYEHKLVIPRKEEDVITGTARERYPVKKNTLNHRRYIQPAILAACTVLLLGAGIFIGMSISKNSSVTSGGKEASPIVKADKSANIPTSVSGSGAVANKISSGTETKDDLSIYPALITDAGKTKPAEDNKVNVPAESKTELSGAETKRLVKQKEKMLAESSRALPRKNNLIDSNASTITFVQRQATHRTDAVNEKEFVKSDIGNLVSVSSSKYNVGTFGGISELQLTLSNRSIYPLDLVMVEVQYIQANKKIYKTENIYYRNVRPGESVMQEAPKSPRGVKIQYKVALINSKEPSVSYSGI